MTAGPGVAVPAYFHPAVARREWTRLAEHADVLRFVVVNVHNGVGTDIDPLYLEVTAELRAAGVRLVGYVDTDYGQRPVQEVLAEAGAYRDRYGINGIFLDQTAAQLDALSHYEKCATGLRAAGVRFLVLNPGCHPHPAYVDLANVTVTFEGSWDDYQTMTTPEWVGSRPPSRYCHLVYDVPHDPATDPATAIAARHVGAVCLTEGQPPVVWDRLPTVLEAA